MVAVLSLLWTLTLHSAIALHLFGGESIPAGIAKLQHKFFGRGAADARQLACAPVFHAAANDRVAEVRSHAAADHGGPAVSALRPSAATDELATQLRLPKPAPAPAPTMRMFDGGRAAARALRALHTQIADELGVDLPRRVAV